MRELNLSRVNLCRLHRGRLHPGSDREDVIATTLVCGNKISFQVKAVSALILTVSEIRPDSTVRM